MTARSAGILLPYQREWVDDRSRFKIWLASRQIGKSFALTLEPVLDTVERQTNWVYLSVGERQARELAEKAKLHLDAIKMAAAAMEDYFLGASGDRYTQLEYRLPNGARHIFLPANPDTARGYTANLALDEFAFHKDSKAIWTALYPSITRHADLKVRICSTPNGKSNKFFELWEGRDEKATGKQVWSRHRTDIFEAVAAGLAVDPEELRLALADDFAWAQEYLLEFTEENTAYLSYELIASCEDANATTDQLIDELDPGTPKFLGFDVGRHRDLSVIWILEKVGDVHWTRRVLELRNTPFATQREVLYGLLPYVNRACIDATGLGEQLAEEAKVKFGYRVEPVKFTAEVKNDLATTTRRTCEDKRVRIPVDRAVREDLHSVRRLVTSAGNIRFDAEREEGSHADRFWALALALHAGGSTSHAPFEIWKVPRRTDRETFPDRADRSLRLRR
jgi:phage FluMu gp28-like protein